MSAAHVVWVPPMEFEADVPGTSFVMDATKEYGGRGAGPTPMETALIALAGCSGMDVVSILNRMQAPLKGLRVDVSGERASGHPKVFTEIALRYTAWGSGLREDDVRKAITLSLDKYCSVAAMLRSTATITYEVHVLEGQPQNRLVQAGRL